MRPQFTWHTPAQVLMGLGKGTAVILVFASLFLGFFALKVETDSSGVSFSDEDSQAYKVHKTFVSAFGIDDYVLIAFDPGFPLTSAELPERLSMVRTQILNLEGISSVFDLGRLSEAKLPGMHSIETPWNRALVERMRNVLPGAAQLVSRDMQTLGIVVGINNEILNGFRLEARIQEIKTVIKDTFPGVQDCYAAGIPVIRAAFERYNLTNALIFGGLGLIFGTVTAFCLFKTIWSAVLVMINALVALLWLLGIMGVFGIHVNLASGLSFGFVLIVSCTTVFHILAVYLATLDKTKDASHALMLAYQSILRPCFMCALTTATGFLCLTLSPVPMVRQAGIVIGLGVMMSFLLALPITRLFLPLIKKSQPFGKRLSSKPSNRQGEHGILDRAAHLLKIPGFKYPRAMLAGGVMFLIVAAIGIPKIGFIRHLSQPMVKHTAEAKEMAIIQDRLAAGYSFSLLLERGLEDVFKTRKFWYDLAKLENRLKNIDGVTRIDSLTSLVFRLAMGTPQAGIMPERIFSMLEEERRKNEEGETIITRFLNDNTMRIEIHLTDLSSDQIEILLHQVETIATRMLKDSVEVSLAGQLVYLRAQNMGLVSSQLYSLGLALITITVFMIIQLKSVRLGLLSLIPNVFPLVCIFGIMGWFGIALDPLTIFAAVISFGLSVDDSIHYLEAFRQEIRGKNYDVTECLSRAYNKTARALVATTAVLFLSSGGLMLSPISHVASLGVLVAFASLTALAGDLMILPALVGKLEVLYKGQVIHCNGDV